MRDGSFFSGSHLKLNEIVEFFTGGLVKLQYSINFVDPTTGAHTQTIEGTWSQVKFMMRKRGVMNPSDDLFDTYLPENLWRRKFKYDDPSLKMYEHVKEQYPL